MLSELKMLQAEVGKLSDRFDKEVKIVHKLIRYTFTGLDRVGQKGRIYDSRKSCIKCWKLILYLFAQ